MGNEIQLLAVVINTEAQSVGEAVVVSGLRGGRGGIRLGRSRRWRPQRRTRA